MRIVELQCDVGVGGERLDRFLAGRLPSLSRAFLQRLIRRGLVELGGAPVSRPASVIRGREFVRVAIPRADDGPRFELAAEHVLYRDRDLLVLDKPAGIPTRSRLSFGDGGLYEAARRYLGRGRPDAPTPPYLAMPQRLDRETSGVIVFACTREAARALPRAFLDRRVHKSYLALVGRPPEPERGRIDAPIHAPGHCLPSVSPAGKPARTVYRTLSSGAEAALLLLRPRTGRTHQLRLHLAHLGVPILGDPLYGPRYGERRGAERTLLHARTLSLRHPTSDARLRFRAPLPTDMRVAPSRPGGAG